MADFEKYYPTLEKHEGGYCSEEKAKSIGDRGGETYLGIARNFNPEWEGWLWIDECKAKNGIPKWNSKIPDERLKPSAKKFSKMKYWDALKADQILNQSIAEYIVDFGYNSGIVTAAKALQKLTSVTVDGKIGPKTIEAVNTMHQEELFHKLVEYRVDFLNKITSLREDVKQGVIRRAKSFKFEK
jgi:lysozyme family protein